MAIRLTDEVRLLRTVTERELDEDIKAECKRLGYRRYHTYRADRSPAGFPDLVLLRPPSIIYAELKREQAEPTPEQVAWLDDLARAGQLVFLWKPSDFKRGDVTNVLDDPDAWVDKVPSRWDAPRIT